MDCSRRRRAVSRQRPSAIQVAQKGGRVQLDRPRPAPYSRALQGVWSFLFRAWNSHVVVLAAIQQKLENGSSRMPFHSTRFVTIHPLPLSFPLPRALPLTHTH
jgi:hypothetical protein